MDEFGVSAMPLPKKTFHKKTSMELSQLDSSLKTADAKDLRTKLRMADKMYKFVSMPIKMIAITPALLGIDRRLFTKLEQKKAKGFNFASIERINKEKNSCTYMDIREVLLEHYIEKQEILNNQNLLVELNNRSFRFKDGCFNSVLKSRGFIWRKLPGSKKAIIIEHPKKVQERQRYFNRLQQYRKENRPIIFIEEKYYINNRFDKNTLDFMQGKWCLVVVTEHTLIKAGIYVYPPPTETFIYKWFSDDLIPLLPKNSVVVIEERLNCEVDNVRYPNGFNSKQELKKWLDENSIPYEDTMNKAELMTLVNKFTEEKGMILDEVLKNYGHDVLRRQKGFPNLSVMTAVTKYLQTFDDRRKPITARKFGNIIIGTLKACTEEQWKEMFDHMKLEETRIIEEDSLLDEVIDKLMSMIAKEGLKEDHNLDNYEKDFDSYVKENKDIKPCMTLATIAYNITHNRSRAYEI